MTAVTSVTTVVHLDDGTSLTFTSRRPSPQSGDNPAFVVAQLASGVGSTHERARQTLSALYGPQQPSSTAAVSFGSRLACVREYEEFLAGFNPSHGDFVSAGRTLAAILASPNPYAVLHDFKEAHDVPVSPAP